MTIGNRFPVIRASFATLLAIAATYAAPTTQPTPTVHTFDSARVPKLPPFLFYSAHEYAAARTRVGGELKPVVENLRAKAREAMSLALEPFPTTWWQEAKGKPWEETYPEIFLHTSIEPTKLALAMEALVFYGGLTGDEAALAKASEILLHLTAFSFEPEHYDVGMNYSVWGWRVLRAYDVLFPRLREADRERVDDFFTRLGRAVLANDVYWIDNNVGGGINNHLAWHKTMLGLLGLFYDDDSLVDYALRGRRGLIELLEVGCTDDGLWCEGSLVYHFAAVVPMVLYADALRHAGHPEDFYICSYADGRTLRQTLDSMFGVLLPDGTIPPVGDAYGQRTSLANVSVYESAWSAYGDTRYAWLLSRATQRKPEALFAPSLPAALAPPRVASRLYPEHGYAFLRFADGGKYWDSDARCAFLTFDRARVHSNADKLSLMLFGGGKLLLPDVEGIATVPHAFSSRIQRELNRGALSQNTIMIDEQDQRYSDQTLDLVEYRDLPDEKRVTAADRRGLLYDGVRQQRTVCLCKEYTLDVFQVQCGTPRRIDWVMHVLDDQTQRAGGIETAPADVPGKHPAWGWLKDFRSAETAGAWHATWRSGSVHLRLDMFGEPGTRVIECGYPASDQPTASHVPMIFVRRHGSQATFVAVYTTGSLPPGDVRIETLPAREGRMVLAVESAGVGRVHQVPKL